MDFLKPCWKQDLTEHRFHIKYWSHIFVTWSFTIFNQPKAHVVIFLLWFDKQANIKVEVLLILRDELNVLQAIGGKGGQKNEKVILWELQVQFIVMAAAKKIQGAAEIVHGVYYPETNLRHSAVATRTK